jgi:hypothetical protein
MSNTLSQIPLAVAAASTLLTVWYVGRKGQGRSRSESWPGRRQRDVHQVETKVIRQTPRRRLRYPR